MTSDVSQASHVSDLQTVDWVAFPGGELEGPPPAGRCAACRRLGGGRLHGRQPVCFQCYRDGQRREQLIREAAQRETTSEAQFQWTLPFEPVNARRLESLKALRATARASQPGSISGFADRRHRAQIAARHMLQMLEAGLQSEPALARNGPRALAAAAHVAELQFPDAWLPFVVAR